MERGNKEREDLDMESEIHGAVYFAHGLILGGILTAFALLVVRK
jgi:hypothetical protein